VQHYNPTMARLKKYAIFGGIFSLFGCDSPKPEPQKPDETVQKINLDNILYTTPTINNSLPQFTEKTETCVVFHEDDWRQTEFISKNQKASIDKEIQEIRDVLENHSHHGDSYTGYRKLTVRELITEPLTVDFEKLKSYLTDDDIELSGVELGNNDGQVNGGFYFSTNGINYYGQRDNQLVGIFCIHSVDSFGTSLENLSRLLKEENLFLVDWRSATVYDEITILTDL